MGVRGRGMRERWGGIFNRYFLPQQNIKQFQFKPRRKNLLQGRALSARIAISVRMNNFIFL
jgi:hypothetical protein